MAVSNNLVRRIIEGTDMTEEQAVALAEAIAEQDLERHKLELAETRLSGAVESFSAKIDVLSSVLRADVAKVETVLRADMNAALTGLKADMNAGLNRVETELKADVAKVETELKSDVAKVETGLKADVARLEHGQDKLRTEAKGRLWRQSLIVAVFLAAVIGVGGPAGEIVRNLFIP